MKTFDQFILENTKKRGQRYDSRMNFDADSKHPDITISKVSTRGTIIHHKPSGITYSIGHYSRNHASDLPDSKMHDDKPHHTVSFDHTHNTEKLSSSERRKLARDAENVFHAHVKPRLPSGHMVSNIPLPNYRVQDGKVVEADARKRIYKRHGFGEVGKDRENQYAVKIGNKLHPVHNTGFPQQNKTPLQ